MFLMNYLRVFLGLDSVYNSIPVNIDLLLKSESKKLFKQKLYLDKITILEYYRKHCQEKKLNISWIEYHNYTPWQTFWVHMVTKQLFISVALANLLTQ